MSRKAVILIPALDPPRRELRVLLEELYRFSPGRGILLVNDGSREEYNSFFRELQKEFPDLLLLENSRNMGKGYSLRKGIAFILENFPSSPLITCDCDGQHSAADIEKIAALAEKEKLDLILGIREFSGKNIPFRSWLGNRVASFFFRLVTGRFLADTQTGLRALSPAFAVARLRDCRGDGYEWEMAVLLAACRENLSLREVKISTLYSGNNHGSHFSPFRDSCRILKVLFYK